MKHWRWLGMLGACAMATAVACGSGGNSSDPLQPTAAYPNCTQTVDFWLNNPGAWPVTTLVLGEVTYSQNQLLQILAQPRGDNGLVNLAQAVIIARLNIAEGADDSAVSLVLSDADGFIGLRLPPPIGLDSLPTATTGALVDALDNFNKGEVGPGLCEAEDAGTADAAADAGDAGHNCTEPASFWLDNPDSWPVFDSLTLGTIGYSPNQLLQILAQPPGENGLIVLAQAQIAVKLSLLAGADDSVSVDTLTNQADALIDMLLPPPIGIDVLPEALTADLVASLNDFAFGTNGPGRCPAPDAGSDAGSDAAVEDAGTDAHVDEDAGSDAAVEDAGTDARVDEDAGPGEDAGNSDAGNRDAGNRDAGNRDAGNSSGNRDAGMTF